MGLVIVDWIQKKSIEISEKTIKILKLDNTTDKTELKFKAILLWYCNKFVPFVMGFGMTIILINIGYFSYIKFGFEQAIVGFCLLIIVYLRTISRKLNREESVSEPDNVKPHS